MTKIHNTSSCPREFIDDADSLSPMKTIALGSAAGSERLYVNIDYIKPGAKSAKYHSHSLQEEFFLILKGSGVLRINDEMIEVSAGDFVAKPAGKGIAHQFINNGDDILQILDCGTKDRGDVVTYPDEGIIFVKDIGKAFKGENHEQQWSSEPICDSLN